jgi:polyhydroxyalkanoate synthesis regulator phasin
MVGGAMASIGVASLGSAGLVSAATTPGNDDPKQSLIDSIATKFNLNKDEVKKVFDENHEAREAKHEQKLADRLAEAVKDGKLTQEQADKLTAKLSEMHESRETNREALKDKTPAERKETMKAERDAFKQWLTVNNIPEEFGGPMGSKGEGRGHHGGMRMHEDDSSSSESNNI